MSGEGVNTNIPKDLHYDSRMLGEIVIKTLSIPNLLRNT